ncbi:glycosyltransferase [Thermus sp.]|uniref:glycosyltransferase n=1 Tax=Thermus sp. TaxID=275 RepID=UPI003D14FCC2
MRVIHLILGRCNPGSANGVDKTVYYLARHQAALGANVAVFSLTQKDPIPIEGAEVHTFPPPPKWARLVPLPPGEVLKAILKWKPDIVHFHSVHIGPFVGLGRRLKRQGIPYVVTPHGAFAPGRLARVPPWVRLYIQLVEKSYLEEVHFVYAVSQNDVEGLKLLGIQTRPVVIPNGIDLSAVPKNVDASLLRRRFPSLQGKRVFLFLGRLDPAQKGLDILLEAFARADLPDAALVLVGPDWRGSLEKLKATARKLGIEEKVIFAGPAYGEEKWAYLAGADVFVHPSRWEGLSVSVLEALVMGKPVLVSQAADPGGIGAYGAGVAVEPRVVELSEALRALGRFSPEELQRMGHRGQTLVEEQYGWRAIAARLMEVYQREVYGAR